MLDLFIDGIAAIATPDTLALMILGVIVGIIFGSVPGLTAVTGIALFLPVTYSLGPIKGMALLMAIYIGAVSGGRWLARKLTTASWTAFSFGVIPNTASESSTVETFLPLISTTSNLAIVFSSFTL